MSAPNHTPPLLAEPPIDRPAAEDPLTAQQLRAADRLIRLRMVSAAVTVAVLLVVGVGLLVGSGNFAVLVGTAVVAILLPRAFLAKRKWLRGMVELAGRTPWRPASAVVVRARPCVLRVDDGSGPHFLRVPFFTGPAQVIIAMAGKVWLLGPDADRRTGVLLPGFRTPTQGIPVPAPTEVTGPVVPPPGGSGTALDEPVTAAIVRQWRSAVVRSSVLIGMLLLIGLLMIGDGGPAVVVLGSAVVLAGTTGWALRRLPALRRGLRRGPWTAVPTRLDPWPDTDRGNIRLRGRIQLPDGREAGIELRGGSRMLCEHVAVSGVLHFAGAPVPGRTSTIVVPGTLLLGLATVDPV